MELARLTGRAQQVQRRFNETVAAPPGADVDLARKLAYEPSDCLWRLPVLAQEYGVDLERESPATMEGIEAKLAGR